MRAPSPPAELTHAWYKLYAYVCPERLADGWDRARIQAALDAEGVPVRQGSCSEIYLEEAFAAPGLRPPERLPVARELGDTSLMFLVHPTLEAAHMHQIGAAVARVMAEATL